MWSGHHSYKSAEKLSPNKIINISIETGTSQNVEDHYLKNPSLPSRNWTGLYGISWQALICFFFLFEKYIGTNSWKNTLLNEVILS